jgi:hypothetical protein
VPYGRISYGPIPQFLGGNTTAARKTLNSEVLMELQFAQDLERELPSKLRRQKDPLFGEPNSRALLE